MSCIKTKPKKVTQIKGCIITAIETLSDLEDFKLSRQSTKSKDVPFPTPENHKFIFIDLFAGIGGFRIAFQNLGGKCVFSSEIDPYAQKTYESNFGKLIKYGI